MDAVLTTGTLLAAGEGGTFVPPGIEEFFPPAILFAGTPFELNRIGLIRILAAVVLIVVMVVAARKAKLLPSRGQSVVEMGLDFVRTGIAEDVLGKKHGKTFLPLITTIFFLVLFTNLTGFIPFLNIAGSSVAGFPLVLAAIVYFTYHIAGIKELGFGGYLKNAIILPNVPPAMHILLIPIEFITKFVLQPFTLFLRLLANMLVGHLLLVLAFAATWFFFFDAEPAYKAFGILTLGGGVFITLLEMLVAVLQAYIFALLTAVYINGAVSKDH